MGVRTELFVLATAEADTVRTGIGPVEYAPEGLLRPADDVHGQRVRLDRVGGDVPADLARAAGGQAVIVPHGSECGQVYSWETARWAEPGAQVFVDVSLRPREQWVGGVPTFDADVAHDGYPGAYDYIADDSVPRMTAAEVFVLNQALPTWEQAEAAPMDAYRPLLAWARAHPELTAHMPAVLALDAANEVLQPCVTAPVHPVAGTWDARVVVDGADTLHAFFRTTGDGHALCRSAPLRLDLEAVTPRPADTLRLYVHGASSPAAIPLTNRQAGTTGCNVGLFTVANDADSERGGRWSAEFNERILPGCFDGRAGLYELIETLFQAYENDTYETDGAFTQDADGAMRFRQVWRAAGRTRLEMTAVRIDTEVLPPYSR